MSKTEMVHIVDMTADELAKVADWHRSRGEIETADSVLRLVPVLPHLLESQRASLREFPPPVLRAALSEIVLACEFAEIQRLGT